MKKFLTRLFSVILAAVLIAVIRVGVDKVITELFMGPKIEELSGVWEVTFTIDSETVQEVLEYEEFYPEEIALLDLNSMECVKLVEFREDRTYEFRFDTDATKKCVREYFVQAIAQLYSQRAQLVDTYGDVVLDMTQAEFEQAYAELFGLENIDALLDLFQEDSLNYDSMAEPLETGTYTIEDNTILCTIDGDDHAEGIRYSLNDDQLTLTYSDDVEYYTRRG